jgi:CshA-type fibril repeat protein
MRLLTRFAMALLLAGPVLLAPAPAVAATWGPLTSTGSGLRKQTVVVGVPAGWRLTLDGRDPDYVDTVLVPQGFYTQDSPTKVTFTPNVGYLGPAAPVTIRLTGPAGQTRVSTYAATVTRPAPPPAPDLTSSGPPRAQQEVGFTLPAGGSHGYVDAPSDEFSLAAISGIATVPGRPMDPTLISARGFLMFTPRRGFSGVVPAVRYRVTDAYGQSSIGRWTPTVTGYSVSSTTR